jgi:hypothetical protein
VGSSYHLVFTLCSHRHLHINTIVVFIIIIIANINIFIIVFIAIIIVDIPTITGIGNIIVILSVDDIISNLIIIPDVYHPLRAHRQQQPHPRSHHLSVSLSSSS